MGLGFKGAVQYPTCEKLAALESNFCGRGREEKNKSPT